MAAVFVMGHPSDRETTSKSASDSSRPPGARRSSRTSPRAMTADSLVAPFTDSNDGSGREPLLAETWTYPAPSLMMTKTSPPTACLRATHPRTSAFDPAGAFSTAAELRTG